VLLLAGEGGVRALARGMGEDAGERRLEQRRTRGDLTAVGMTSFD